MICLLCESERKLFLYELDERKIETLPECVSWCDRQSLRWENVLPHMPHANGLEIISYSDLRTDCRKM